MEMDMDYEYHGGPSGQAGPPQTIQPQSRCPFQTSPRQFTEGFSSMASASFQAAQYRYTHGFSSPNHPTFPGMDHPTTLGHEFNGRRSMPSFGGRNSEPSVQIGTNLPLPPFPHYPQRNMPFPSSRSGPRASGNSSSEGTSYQLGLRDTPPIFTPDHASPGPFAWTSAREQPSNEVSLSPLRHWSADSPSTRSQMSTNVLPPLNDASYLASADPPANWASPGARIGYQSQTAPHPRWLQTGQYNPYASATYHSMGRNGSHTHSSPTRARTGDVSYGLPQGHGNGSTGSQSRGVTASSVASERPTAQPQMQPSSGRGTFDFAQSLEMQPQRLERARAARRAAAAAQKPVASSAFLKTLESVDISDKVGDDRCCVICYNEFGIKNPDGQIETAVRLPKCKHVFGDYCLKQWLKDSNTCPYCRDKLPSEPKRSSDLVNQVTMRDLVRLSRDNPAALHLIQHLERLERMAYRDNGSNSPDQPQERNSGIQGQVAPSGNTSLQRTSSGSDSGTSPASGGSINRNMTEAEYTRRRLRARPTPHRLASAQAAPRTPGTTPAGAGFSAAQMPTGRNTNPLFAPTGHAPMPNTVASNIEHHPTGQPPVFSLPNTSAGLFGALAPQGDAQNQVMRDAEDSGLIPSNTTNSSSPNGPAAPNAYASRRRSYSTFNNPASTTLETWQQPGRGAGAYTQAPGYYSPEAGVSAWISY